MLRWHNKVNRVQSFSVVIVLIHWEQGHPACNNITCCNSPNEYLFRRKPKLYCFSVLWYCEFWIKSDISFSGCFCLPQVIDIGHSPLINTMCRTQYARQWVSKYQLCYERTYRDNHFASDSGIQKLCLQLMHSRTRQVNRVTQTLPTADNPKHSCSYQFLLAVCLHEF